MRRLTISVLAALLLTLASVGGALGHVHGITPLSCNAHDNAAQSGGNGTNGTPADDANGGPIAGVIPIATGNSPLQNGDGGRGHSALCNTE